MDYRDYIKGLDHIAVLTKDHDKSLDFYVDKLGFSIEYQTVAAREEEGNLFFPLRFALLVKGSCVIELLEPYDKENIVKPGLEGIVSHFGLRVERIEELVEALKAQGVAVTGPVSTGRNLFNGYKGTFILGPSGEKIELFELL